MMDPDNHKGIKLNPHGGKHHNSPHTLLLGMEKEHNPPRDRTLGSETCLCIAITVEFEKI